MSTRLAGLYAILAAAASVVFAPLLALAYSRTSEGADEFESATLFPGWTERGIDLAGPLLTFAPVDRVYSVYTQLFALLVPAVLVCALTARSLRPAPRPRLERWGWRVALFGHALFALGLLLVASAMFVVDGSHAAIDVPFMTMMFPGLLLSLLGSTVLGVGLLRSAYEPRLTPWLLVLALPLWWFGSFGLGHNSLGLVPLMVAWGVTGYRLWRGGARNKAAEVAFARPT
jgi:hypothetical protein